MEQDGAGGQNVHVHHLEFRQSTFSQASLNKQVTLNKLELRTIFNVYGHMVAASEWRDYTIDFLKERAVFSIFRHSSEMPLYRIEKDPRLAARQGMYSVIGASGQILKRGHILEQVLQIFDKKLNLVRD